ncbi:uncharacterized protein CDV56_102789 [Aspergillus thermomutatus]|uniref:Uncharacterized protein n=1 Tax=Aspergillus thermomutatus TaxID=41047 RepID=A0A397GBK3_ASPTH|nr:uncharacterized protein CDV56_102789 [Aspergillus thermomutatus]RHZ48331.1 hypothetical protein CDV56_102789 [Aspergillus thermomutatus]
MSPKSSSINTFQQESVETPDTAKKRLWDSEQPQKPSYKRTRARIAELDEEVQSLQPSTQRETCDLAAKLDRLENENRKLHRVLEAIKVAVAEDEDGDKSYENDTSDRSRKISLEPPNAYYGEGVDVVSLLYEGLLSFDPKTPHESSIHPRPERVPITIPPTMLHPIPRKINQIYEYVFRISNGDAREVENADPGLIFKAINEGWETLHAKTMQNPLFLILFHIDQRIFYQQQKVTRLAILYKDLNLFKAGYLAE